MDSDDWSVESFHVDNPPTTIKVPEVPLRDVRETQTRELLYYMRSILYYKFGYMSITIQMQGNHDLEDVVRSNRPEEMAESSLVWVIIDGTHRFYASLYVTRKPMQVTSQISPSRSTFMRRTMKATSPVDQFCICSPCGIRNGARL